MAIGILGNKLTNYVGNKVFINIFSTTQDFGSYECNVTRTSKGYALISSDLSISMEIISSTCPNIEERITIRGMGAILQEENYLNISDMFSCTIQRINSNTFRVVDKKDYSLNNFKIDADDYIMVQHQNMFYHPEYVSGTLEGTVFIRKNGINVLYEDIDVSKILYGGIDKNTGMECCYYLYNRNLYKRFIFKGKFFKEPILLASDIFDITQDVNFNIISLDYDNIRRNSYSEENPNEFDYTHGQRLDKNFDYILKIKKVGKRDFGLYIERAIKEHNAYKLFGQPKSNLSHMLVNKDILTTSNNNSKDVYENILGIAPNTDLYRTMNFSIELGVKNELLG